MSKRMTVIAVVASAGVQALLMNCGRTLDSRDFGFEQLFTKDAEYGGVKGQAASAPASKRR